MDSLPIRLLYLYYGRNAGKTGTQRRWSSLLIGEDLSSQHESKNTEEAAQQPKSALVTGSAPLGKRVKKHAGVMRGICRSKQWETLAVSGKGLCNSIRRHEV